jgi:hypothetical protein
VSAITVWISPNLLRFRPRFNRPASVLAHQAGIGLRLPQSDGAGHA